jgi:long-chain acyl-CoA synthetase
VVIGVEDEVLGQAVRAFVVPVPGVELDERRLRRALIERLENFMLPRDIVFREALPKSPNGKIDRGWSRLIGQRLAGTCRSRT